MDSFILTKAQARRFLLAHHGLWPPYTLEGKGGVLHYLHRVGCIQFDPLNIVGHNPELVLQARVSAFQPRMLRELLYVDRKLLDGFDKMMSIYRVEDWPYFHRRRAAARRRLGPRIDAAASILPQIRKAIEERGPLSSLDLTYDQKVDWSWSPTRLARAALESMYFWGELVIHHKIHTRKVYDFARRHIPAELLSAPDPNETEAQYQEWHVLRRIGSVGLLWRSASSVWHGIQGTNSKDRNATITRLLHQGQVLEIHVEGITPPFYMRREDKPRLTRLLRSDDCFPRAAVLAPLDNLLWDRRLVADLFDFDYRWEVYTPVAQRRYGYYVLPILYGDRFVARFEPGHDKTAGAFIIKQWWWEPGVTPSERMRVELSDCFKRFLTYLNATTCRVEGPAANQAGLDWLPSAVNET
jgi:uncharacterized protein YcaQ